VLLEAGAKTEASDEGGLAPLFDAANADHSQMVELQLEHGVSVTAKDHAGITPIRVAENSTIEVQMALAEHLASTAEQDAPVEYSFEESDRQKPKEEEKFLDELKLPLAADDPLKYPESDPGAKKKEL